MADFVPNLSTREYEKNFAELTTALSANQAVAEANRCLFCYDAPCMRACPTHIDVPGFIKKIATENLKGSAKTILSSNWIALTCAKACPVDVLCEGACVYNERGEKPIEIGRLQRFAIDRYFANGMAALFTPASKKGKSVGIIGSGPAGLACAAELALLGYDVVVYEGRKVAGGLAAWGLAPYKVTPEDSAKEVELIKSLGVRIETGVWVGKDVTLPELENRHDSLFIGVGLTQPTTLRIPGEDLDGVSHALDFIERVTKRDWASVKVGRRVAVIGAGNTAIDAATEAKRLGAESVMIIYRRSENEMPAYKYEYDLAKRDGVVFHFLTAPTRILGTTAVESIECVKMTLGEPDADGRRRPVPIPNSTFQILVDMVITSLGYEVSQSNISQIQNLKTENGLILIDPETMQTSNPKYFAGGDCTNGGKEVVDAAAHGKRAALGIDRYLTFSS